MIIFVKKPNLLYIYKIAINFFYFNCNYYFLFKLILKYYL